MKKQFLDLGKQPIANGFLYKEEIKDEFFFDLKVGFDKETKLVTQMEYVDPPLMFNENYSYRGSMSKTMKNHFKEFSKSFSRFEKVLEIGSNDGVFLKNFSPSFAISVEPCTNFAKETQEMGYTTYPEFWTSKLAKNIEQHHGKIDKIFAANCICHIPDLDDTFKAVESLLDDNGIFIFEDPSLAEMINNNSYDQIYDEHPHIFSVIALSNLLERNGLEIVKVDNLKVHGGSNRIYAMKIGKGVVDESFATNVSHERILGLDKFETFKKFTQRVEQSKKDLVNLLKQCKKQNTKVISYGATSKSTTIFNYCNIGPDLIEYITDTTPEKQGKLSPGVHIPIIPPEEGFNDSVDYAYLGAWNFAKEISKKELEYVKRGGKFITHVPIVKFV
jgi:SAM-dependent methyltransferase